MLRTLYRVLTIAAIAAGLILSVQGWRGRLNGFNYDQVINIDEALRVVHGQGVPRYGGLCSFGSHIPPGTAWLFVPGVLTGEPRLFELVGAILLELVTLAGLFLLVRRCSNTSAAWLAMMLYALSALGIMYGSSLWPRAHPAAYVWMTYFVLLWIERRNAWFLSAALIVFSIGLLLYLEMAPAGVMFIVAWWVYRPPLRWSAIATGLIVSLAVWAPYLNFERQRDFIDLRSQLFAQSLHPQQAQDLTAFGPELGTWDEEKGELVDYHPHELAAVATSAKPLRTIALRGFIFARNLVNNFIEFSIFGYLAAILFLATYLAVATHIFKLPQQLERHRWLAAIGGLLIAAGVVANPWVAERVSGKPLNPGPWKMIVVLEALLIAGGLLLVMRRWTARQLHRLDQLVAASSTAMRCSQGAEPPLDSNQPLPFAVLLWLVAGPWLALALLATNAKYQWGLWPLQIAVLAIAAYEIPRRLRWNFLVQVVVLSCVSLGIICNTVLALRGAEWQLDGFAGIDSAEIQAADFVAGQILKDGGQPAQAKIGYQLFFNGFEAVDHDVDPRYYIGSPLNQYLRLRWQIETSPPDAKGFTADDQWRLVERRPRRDKPLRFRSEDSSNFEQVEKFGYIGVWKRKPTGSGVGSP